MVKKVLLVILLILIFNFDKAYAKIAIYSLKDLVRESSLIVIGEVSAIDENSRLGNSTAAVDIKKYIKGSKEKDNKIFIKYEGTSKVWAEDQPVFKKGETTLLFLQKINNNFYRTTDCCIGHVSIDSDLKVHVLDYDGKNIDNNNWVESLFDHKRYYPSYITVDECVERIKKYMSEEVINEKK